MAMTAAVKDELSRVTVAKVSARKAEVSTVLRFAGGLHIVAGRVIVEAELDTGSVARRLRRDIGELYGHTAEVQVLSASGIRKNTRFVLRVVAGGDQLARQTGLLDQRGRPVRGLPAQIVGLPPLFDVVFATGDIADYRATLRADKDMQGRFNSNLREAGIFKGENKYYLSLAHDEADITQTLAAFASAVEAEARLRR